MPENSTHLRNHFSERTAEKSAKNERERKLKTRAHGRSDRDAQISQQYFYSTCTFTAPLPSMPGRSVVAIVDKRLPNSFKCLICQLCVCLFGCCSIVPINYALIHWLSGKREESSRGGGGGRLQESCAGQFRYFFIFSIIKNDIFAFFIKLI